MAPSRDAQQLASLAADFFTTGDSPVTGARIVESVLDLLPEASHASLTVRARGSYETLGTTSELAAQADDAQYTLDEGPCVDAVEGTPWLRSGDVRHDRRWTQWGPIAADLGLHSVLSIRLEAQRKAVGALNIYAEPSGAFADHDDIDLTVVFATHAALALTSARLVDELETAVSSRHTIGMAQGLLMERYGLEADQAFALLRRLSSVHNVKLRVLAAGIIATRAVPLEDPRKGQEDSPDRGGPRDPEGSGLAAAR